ncbi:MAG TPA: hypothetical protein VNG33_04590 [Polyangiaceae bacterium]|nr:hypothetical protein [Polyangiaceae bacterium]
MTPSASANGDAPIEFFRMNPALLRRLPAIAKRQPGKLSPKTTVLVLLALCAQAARRPRSELTITPASGDAMASVALPIRMAEVLESLGYERNGADFSGSAWETVGAAVKQLTSTRVKVAFKRTGSKGLEAAYFRGALVERVDDGKMCLHGYSPPGDRYHVLIPHKVLALRPALTELGTGLVCWLYCQHRGRREGGTVKHKWSLTITPEVLVDAKILTSKNLRRAAELERMLGGFRNLEHLGLLTIEGAAWPFRVHLSPSFFHQEVRHE